MIPIPYGETRICTVTSAAAKPVLCENCRKPYVYLAFRQGQGTGENLLWRRDEEADQDAKRGAEADVQRQLAKAIEPVPCPGCGWYQSNMIEEARRQHLLPWHGLGLLSALFGLPLMVIFWQFHHHFPAWRPGHFGFWLTQGAVFGGLALMAGRFVLSRRLVPNSLPLERRLKLGNMSAVLLEELEKKPDVGNPSAQNFPMKHKLLSLAVLVCLAVQIGPMASAESLPLLAHYTFDQNASDVTQQNPDMFLLGTWRTNTH